MRALNIIVSILFWPFIPFFWIMCRLQAKKCPNCSEKWFTELVDEWDGEDWKCHTCGQYWTVK